MVFPSTTYSCLTTLWSKIKAQGWTLLFTDENTVVAKFEVIDFFKHLSISRGCITSRVGSILFVFDAHTLASKLGDPSRTSVSKVFKKSIFDYRCYLFAFVIKNLIPHQERRDAASYLDLTVLGESAYGAGTSQSQTDGEVDKLRLENVRFLLEIKQLKAHLVKNEETTVAHHNDLMSLIQSLSPLTMSSPSVDTPTSPSVP
ncbi:hypothetical protein HAX54_022144 [Datura stramonium]|uniref:Uncharacterized protein n=1 Tax=Datura stramonium TaxID=4076 RepID=A0ABS8UW76_DATST|nr:hypothetical protein [Datura stramonium]